MKSTGNLNHQTIRWYRHGIFMVFSKANTKYTLQVLHGSYLCSTICKSSLAVNVVVSMQWHFSILTSSINCVREPFNKDFNNVIMLTSSASEHNNWHLIKIGIWGMCAGKCLVRYEVWKTWTYKALKKLIPPCTTLHLRISTCSFQYHWS